MCPNPLRVYTAQNCKSRWSPFVALDSWQHDIRGCCGSATVQVDNTRINRAALWIVSCKTEASGNDGNLVACGAVNNFAVPPLVSSGHGDRMKRQVNDFISPLSITEITEITQLLSRYLAWWLLTGCMSFVFQHTQPGGKASKDWLRLASWIWRWQRRDKRVLLVLAQHFAVDRTHFKRSGCSKESPQNLLSHMLCPQTHYLKVAGIGQLPAYTKYCKFVAAGCSR